MDMQTNTARNFALQLGALISLYVSLSALITLIFGVTDIALPDALDYYSYGSSAWQIRFGIAMLVVFFPTYLMLTRMVNKIRRTETEGAYLTLTKWLIYLSLLVGGAVLLGDLVTVLLTFLNGEITARFLIKAFSLVVIVGSACAYYILDAKGYWITHEKESIRYGALMALVVIIAIVFGFTHIEMPKEQRTKLLDQKRVEDLAQMQNQIGEYYRVKQVLPANTDELASIGYGYMIPVDPETQKPYTYTAKASTTFEVCADFATEGDEMNKGEYASQPYPVGGMTGGSWSHGAGNQCFTRTIDPDFFKKY